MSGPLRTVAAPLPALANEVVRMPQREIVVTADAVDAPRLMKAFLGLEGLEASLVERSGRWEVLLRPEGELGAALARVVECVRGCVESRNVRYATLSIDGRPHSVFSPDPASPAAKAA